MIDVDHADVRKYNEEGAFLRIEAMMEQIEGKKGVHRRPPAEAMGQSSRF
jgi:hypothetical protein